VEGGSDAVEGLDRPASGALRRVCRRAIPEKNQAVYLYEGGDRVQRLAERARQEGALTVYTSLATSESVPLTPGVRKEIRRQSRAVAFA